MENDQELTQLRTISTESGETPKLLDSTVREGLFRLCELYGREVNPVWVSLWTENLSGLSPKVVRRAFAELEKEFMPTAACPFPTPAHLLKFVTHIKGNTVNSEAELAWEQVVRLRRTEWNPDMPDHFQRVFTKLPTQIQQACRASGIFAQPDLDPDQIHVWAKKKFLEAYVRWGENAANAFLLEDGPLKEALTELAKTKALPETVGEFSRSAHKSPPMKFMTREDLPPIAPKRIEHAPKSVSEQLAEMRERGWMK
jgi:hypothetical protein